MLRMLCLAAALLLSPLASAQTSETDQLAAITKRGRLLYVYQHAADLAIKELLEKYPNAGKAVSGWVIDADEEGADAGVTVIFYDKQSTPGSLYLSRVERGKLVSGTATQGRDRFLLKGDRMNFAAARRAAEYWGPTRKLSACSATTDTVVLPPMHGEQHGVFFMSSAHDGMLQLGGHTMLQVNKRGDFDEPRAFGGDCKEIAIPKPGKRIEVAHALDPMPTEIHVWASLVADRPLLVTTTPNKRRWLVDKGMIKRLK